MIIRTSNVPAERSVESYGTLETRKVSDAGGITQYGAYVVTLPPGSRSSERHWHEKEDEMLCVLSGEATVFENDGAHLLVAGDVACWPAGAANAHTVENRSTTPCTYLIVGTRVTHDVCHYPDVDKVLHTEGSTWRLLRESDGAFVKGGTIP